MTIHAANTLRTVPKKEFFIYSSSNEYCLSNVELFLEQHKKTKSKTLLIIDDLQWLQNSSAQKRLFDLLIFQIRQKSRIRIFLLSRANLPGFLVPLQVTKQLIVEYCNALTLDKDPLKELIIKESWLRATTILKSQKV